MIQVNKDFLKNENYIKTVIEKAKQGIITLENDEANTEITNNEKESESDK